MDKFFEKKRKSDRDKISIVIPCYNEQEMVEPLYLELNRVMTFLPEYSYEYIFVDDGSKDRTLSEMKRLANMDERVKYLSFSRNFGKEAALLAGLKASKGCYVATMDADMQDPPELLPDMVHLLEQGDYDNVACRRVTRKGEPLLRSLGAKCFYRFMRKMSDVDIADGARDFRLMNRKMVDGILELKEYNRFSKGIYAWVGFKTYWMEFENVERRAGETKWSFWGLVKYSFDGIVNFSNAPLQFSSVLGIVMTLLSFIAIIFEIVRYFMFGDPVDGWPSLVCIIVFIGGIQLFCMGIMGQYISKTYMEVKGRPHYLVGETNVKGKKKKKKKDFDAE